MRLVFTGTCKFLSWWLGTTEIRQVKLVDYSNKLNSNFKVNGKRQMSQLQQTIFLSRRNLITPFWHKSALPKKEHRINMRKYSGSYYVCSSLLDGTLELVFSIQKVETFDRPTCGFFSSPLIPTPISLIPVSFTCTTPEISPRKLNLFAFTYTKLSRPTCLHNHGPIVIIRHV